MSGVNKAIILGRLGADPDIRYTQDQKSVANLSVATSEVWNDKQSGEKREKTEWHRIVLFDPLSDVASRFLQKGSQVYVEGKLQTRKWQDNNGVEKYTTEIVGRILQFGANCGEQAPAPSPQPQEPAADTEDDDIPF